MKNIQFADYNTTIQFARYNTGQIAMQLIGALESEYPGQPIARATINVPEETLAADETIIKDWAENTGIETALIAAGVIEEDPVRHVMIGHVFAGVFRLTPSAIQAASQTTN